MWTENFQMFKLDLEKGRGTRDQIVNICWIIGKAREYQKDIYFCFIDYAKCSNCVNHKKNRGKFWKWWEYQTTLPASFKNLYAS